MNLSYIINDLKTLSSTKNVIFHSSVSESSDGEIINCTGYNTIALNLQGNVTLRTFNAYLEARSSAHTSWIQIPLYNSNFVLQPNISVNNTRLTWEGDVKNTYIANIGGFSEVRVRLDYINGQVFEINATLSNDIIPTLTGYYRSVRDIKDSASLLTRDTEFIGRKYSVNDNGHTDPNLLRPVWIGGASFVEIVVRNKMNKSLEISGIRFYDSITSTMAASVLVIPTKQIVLPNEVLRINSYNYPEFLIYPGISIDLNHLGRATGDESAGTYDITINIK